MSENYLLVPVDDSEGSRSALKFCLENIAKPTDTIFLLHVYSPFVTVMTGTPAIVPPQVFESLAASGLNAANNVLDSFTEICRSAKIDSKSQAIEGDAREVICAVADQINAKMIVIGSRGLGAIKRAFLGSVSDYVVHNASRPVLVYKSHN